MVLNNIRFKSGSLTNCLRKMSTGNLCFLCDGTTKSRSYHRFPKKPVIRSIWMRICQLEPSDNVNSLRICSSHFTEEDFIREVLYSRGNGFRLKKNAYPTVDVNPPLLPIYSKDRTENEELTASTIETLLRKSEEKKSHPSFGLNCIGQPCRDNEKGEQVLCEHCGVVYYGRHHPKPKIHTNSRVVGRIIADEGKKFNCRFCSKKFAGRGYLIRHETNHTLDQTLFSKQFFRNSKQKQDEQTDRAKKTARKRYQCLSCPKMFHLLSNLKTHERTHTPTEDVEPFYRKILHKKFLVVTNDS